jgi:hypothetical protein
MTQTIMGRLVISSISRFTPSSWDMSLCRSFMGYSFGTAFERIYRRCFFLQDLRLRSIPPTVALRGARSFFVTSLIREKVSIQWMRATVRPVWKTWRFTFPPAALYKQTGRCEVTTAFIAIALFCCQKFDHSRSLFIAPSRSTAVSFASSQKGRASNYYF